MKSVPGSAWTHHRNVRNDARFRFWRLFSEMKPDAITALLAIYREHQGTIARLLDGTAVELSDPQRIPELEQTVETWALKWPLGGRETYDVIAGGIDCLSAAWATFNRWQYMPDVPLIVPDRQRPEIFLSPETSITVETLFDTRQPTSTSLQTGLAEYVRQHKERAADAARLMELNNYLKVRPRYEETEQRMRWLIRYQTHDWESIHDIAASDSRNSEVVRRAVKEAAKECGYPIQVHPPGRRKRNTDVFPGSPR